MYYLIYCENRVLRTAGFKTFEELEEYRKHIEPVQFVVLFGNILQVF